jgi:hypothetical protein
VVTEADIRRLGSNVASPRATRRALPLLALAGLGACTAYSTKRNLPVDCTVQNAYDVDNINAEFSMAWSSHDSTSDAAWTSGDAGNPPVGILTAVATIPDGALCGDATALHVASQNYYNDWGAVFGFYGFGKKVETTRQGLSFWARAPGNTNKSLTIILDDANTYNPGAMCTHPGEIIPPGDGGANCTTYCTPDGGVTSTGPITDGNGNVLSSGTSSAPLPPNGCGNSYATTLVLTTDWQFYTVPFSKFQQQNTPDKVPNSDLKQTGPLAPTTYLLTPWIWNMTFRVPKDSPFDLWVDRLGFYSPKGTGDGGPVGQ